MDGSGTLHSQSGGLSSLPYSTKMRFMSEDGKAGTNPEELLAAAHAGCFAMALSFALTIAGFPPEELCVDAAFSMRNEGVHWFPHAVKLTLVATVPGLTQARLVELAEEAKRGCPISRALSALEITLDARLA